MTKLLIERLGAAYRQRLSKNVWQLCGEAADALTERPVLWRSCRDCQREWPYPVGHTEAEEYVCPVCCYAEVAAAKRAVAAAPTLPPGVA